jgi:hypothetical protein
MRQGFRPAAHASNLDFQSQRPFGRCVKNSFLSKRHCRVRDDDAINLRINLGGQTT